jgi:hypothetical protein
MNSFKWFLLIIFILFIVFGIWEIVDKDKSSIHVQKNINDTTKAVGANLGSRIDTGFKSVHSSIKLVDSDVTTGFKGIKKVNPHIVPFALLRFPPLPFVSQNPYFTKTENKDSVNIKYAVSNYGTGVAFKLKMTGFCLFIIKRKLIVSAKAKPTFANKSLLIYPNKGEWQNITTPVRVPPVIIDSIFLCFKLDFTDSTKKRKSFTKILRCDFNRLELLELDDNLYNYIEGFLIKNKHWERPFRQ